MKLQTGRKQISSRLTNKDAQIGHALEIGYTGEVPATDAYLKLPTLTTAQRTALTAEAGMLVYDSTLGKTMIYNAAGWGATDGTAAGSLDAAYNGGSSITVDASAVALASSLTTDAFTIVGNSVTDNSVASITGTAVTSGTVLKLAAVEATLTTGFYLAAYDGAANDFTIGKYGATVIAGNAGTTVFTITAGNAVLTSGNLTLSSGNVVITSGTISVSGTATLAAINNSGTITSQGIMIIDIDSAEAFLVRRNGDAADVFTIDTTSDAGDINVLVTAGVTTGVAFAVNADTITTGAGVRVDVEAGTMTTGKAILVRDGTTSVFSVADDGAVVIKGTAEGTAALTLTTGDIVVSDGDVTISAGEVAITDGITTTGSGLSFTSGITTSASGAFVITANSATSGVVALITSSGTMTTTGSLLTLTANSATTAAGLLRINGNGLTSGIGAVITSSATAITGAGRLLRVDHTGATGTSAILSEFASAANDETIIVRMTASAALAAGQILDLSGAAMTTGTALDIGNLDALTTGKGINIVSNSSDTGAFTLLNILNDHASATGAIGLTVGNDSTGTTVFIDHNGITGKALYIDAESTTQTGGVVDIDANTVTTGTVIDIGNADALTTGKVINIVMNSSNVGAHRGVFIKEDHASATGSFPLELLNDSTAGLIVGTAGAVSTNYFRFAVINGVTIWVGNGTTANGNLSGTAGDMLINGGSSKVEFCTGTTNWTATT